MAPSPLGVVSPSDHPPTRVVDPRTDPVGPPMTIRTMPGHRLTRLWQLVGAVAVVLGMVLAAVQLLDRFAPAPLAPAPTTGSTSRPTPPAIHADISSAAGASRFVSFAEGASGQQVDLDLSCFETVAEPACILESSGWDEGDRPWLWLWVFAGEPCFAPAIDQDPATRDLGRCQDTSLFWVDPDTRGTLVVLGNIQGAGTTAIKGPWHLSSPAGGAILPANIHGFRLIPAGRPADATHT